MKESHFLETERLIIRKLREEDFADFCAFAMDEEMCRMMGRAPMPDEAAARRNFNWLKDMEKRGYALVLKETGHVIGNLTVSEPKLDGVEAVRGKRGVSLSFSLSRRCQRRGLMLEALRAALDELFGVEGMDYVNSGYFTFNIPSRELHKKLGFCPLRTDCFEVDGEQFEVEDRILWRETWQS